MKTFKHLFSLLLALLIVASLMSLAVFADEEKSGDGTEAAEPIPTVGASEDTESAADTAAAASDSEADTSATTGTSSSAATTAGTSVVTTVAKYVAIAVSVAVLVILVIVVVKNQKAQ